MADVGIEEIISQLETEISGQFGSGPRIKLIPHEDPPAMYPWAGHGPSWGDVFGWAKSLLDTNTAIARTPTWQNIVFAVTAGLGRSIQALSGFVNLSVDYTSTATQLLGTIIEMLLAEMSTTTGILLKLLNEDKANADALIAALNLQMQIDKLELQFQIDETAKFIVAELQGWTMDNIFKPLYENIGQAEAQATLQFQGAMQETAKVQASITPIAILEATAVVAPALAAIAALQAFENAQKTLNDECTTPMCDTMGPKTNLGKWLKALNFAATAALLADLAAMKAGDIDNLMRGLVRLGGGIVDDIDAIFTGGLNVGQALAQTGA